jgi:uroporphyrinogen decarboxylase
VTHKERILALIDGESTDKMAASFWRHFYEGEANSIQLAKSMLDFQAKFDWDLMKINPRKSYMVEDWETLYEVTDQPFVKPQRLQYTVHKTDDWEKINRIDPTKAEVLADHIKAVKLIREGSSDDLPIVMTVFNPISIAGDLIENDAFLVDGIRKNPETIHKVLQNITETFIDFSKESIKAGADGIYLATTQWASSDLITEEEYREFGRKYDLMFLEEIVPLTKFNVMHVCSTSIMLPLFADYPISLFSWDMDHRSNPDAEQGAQILPDKVLMGGIHKNNLLLDGCQADIEAEVEKYNKFAQNHRFILCPDCSFLVTTPDRNLEIIKTKIEQLAH